MVYIRKELHQMTVADLKRRLLSTTLTCLREGLAAIRIANYLNEILVQLGESKGPTGAVMMVDVGGQCSVAGIGKIYEEFLRTGRLMHYAGFGTKPKDYYDSGFDTALYRVFKFDQTYYSQPYDYITYDPTVDVLLQKKQPQKGKRKNSTTVPSHNPMVKKTRSACAVVPTASQSKLDAVTAEDDDDNTNDSAAVTRKNKEIGQMPIHLRQRFQPKKVVSAYKHQQNFNRSPTDCKTSFSSKKVLSTLAKSNSAKINAKFMIAKRKSNLHQVNRTEGRKIKSEIPRKSSNKVEVVDMNSNFYKKPTVRTTNNNPRSCNGGRSRVCFGENREHGSEISAPKYNLPHEAGKSQIDMNEVHRLLNALEGFENKDIFANEKFPCNKSLTDLGDITPTEFAVFSNDSLPDTSFCS